MGGLVLLMLGGGALAVLIYRSTKEAEAAVQNRRPPHDVGTPQPKRPQVSPVIKPVTAATATAAVARPYPRGPDITTGDVDLDGPAITQWLPAINAVMPRTGIPPRYAQAWLGIESGGNPCAVGGKTATGPDGYPRELGPFQAYNPFDLQALGVGASEFCSFCVRPAAGPKKKPAKDGGFYDGSQINPQQTTAPLTAAQMLKQVEIGSRLIALKRADADRALKASGVTWPDTSPDYWAAVKVPHGWPAILGIGLPAVTKHLGRAPASWSEFRRTYEQIEPGARYNPALAAIGAAQAPIFRSLRNAEWVGFHAPGQPLPDSPIPATTTP